MNGLDNLRNDIERIDENILDLLFKRKEKAKEIGMHKKANNLPIVDQEQFAQVLETRKASAKRKGLCEKYIEDLRTVIHNESVKAQETV